MTETIRVDDETYAALARLKADDESFDDLLVRLLEHSELRGDQIREGAGFWEDSDAAEEAREAREVVKSDIGTQRQ